MTLFDVIGPPPPPPARPAVWRIRPECIPDPLVECVVGLYGYRWLHVIDVAYGDGTHTRISYSPPQEAEFLIDYGEWLLETDSLPGLSGIEGSTLVTMLVSR